MRERGEREMKRLAARKAELSACSFTVWNLRCWHIPCSTRMSQTEMGRVPEEVSVWLGSTAPHLLQVSPVFTVVQAVDVRPQ